MTAKRQQAESERDDAIERVEELEAEIEEANERFEELSMEAMLVQQELTLCNDGDGNDYDGDRSNKRVSDMYSNGRYDDRMKMAVFACMTANVGKDAVAPLIRRIVESLTGQTIKRLPAPSTIAGWASELGTLARIQTFERLTADPTAPKVIAHDGTSKSGKKLGTARHAVARRVGGSRDFRELTRCVYACVRRSVCTSVAHPNRRRRPQRQQPTRQPKRGSRDAANHWH